MEKVGFEKRNPAEREAAINELKNNKAVVALLKKRGLSPDVIDDNFVAVSNWLQQYSYCQMCQGLEMCNHQIKGYQYQLDEHLNTVYGQCQFATKKANSIAHKDNYLLCDLSDDSLQNFISKIDLTDEPANYKSIVSWVEKWLEDPPIQGFYFHGGLGVGKSYLASCITNEMAVKGHKVAFVNFPKLATDLRNNVTEDDYVENRLKKLRSAYVLVIDDLGAENTTNFIRDDILFTVLDYRMEHGKRTIITSNLSLDALEKKLYTDDEIKASRVIERIRTLCMTVPMKGQSRRIGR